MLKKLKRRLKKLWDRAKEWPKAVARWILEMCEYVLIGCLEMVDHGLEKLGRSEWDD